VKRTAVSLQRRQLMIASLAGIAAPALFASSGSHAEMSATMNIAPGSGEQLVLSGRVVTRQGAPLQGATIETTRGIYARAATDADGRFMLVTATPRAGTLSYRITHDAHGTHEGILQLTHVDTARHVHAQRDDAGVWRAAFGVTLA
jgi:protocatechuate 3,4-dioxygenase beta subunit